MLRGGRQIRALRRAGPVTHLAWWPFIVLAGAGVGICTGLFGVGGSSVATPVLALLGAPGLIAVASPLPATIPSAAVGAIPYIRSGEARYRAAAWSVLGGVPGTVAGALLSPLVGGPVLLIVSGLVLVVAGLRVSSQDRHAPHNPQAATRTARPWRRRHQALSLPRADAAPTSGGTAAAAQRGVKQRREQAHVPGPGRQRDQTDDAHRPSGRPADDHAAHDQRRPGHHPGHPASRAAHEPHEPHRRLLSPFPGLYPWGYPVQLRVRNPTFQEPARM
jgi:hypothetical protein